MIKELSDPQVYQFMIDHESGDLAKLALAQKRHPGIPVGLVASQIKSRIKAKSKLPEWYSTSGILFPHGVSLEQSSSEITAKYKATLVNGRSFLDLTGGTGVDCYYLSQRFENSAFVEQDQALCELAQFNFEKLRSEILVIKASAEKHLKGQDGVASCIYLDPSRRSIQKRKVFLIEDCSPDILEIQNRLLEKGDSVLIKFSPLLDISEVLRKLRNVSEIHVVSVDNDCKELLVKLEKKDTPVRIHTVNLLKTHSETFDFPAESRESQPITYSMPKTYLFEPNSSIMKSGGFKALAEQYKVSKLHPNSHLFTSDNPINNFPGRSFEIQAIEPLKRKRLSNHLPGNQANISVRNFPLSVAQIRKKTSIRDGGETYMFATTLKDEQLKILVCKKVG